MKMILYCRVSTSDQTLDHQVTQARAAGFAIDEVVSDNGVSGVSTRLAERDQGKRLFDLLRRGDVLVVRWIDRLGRNYADVTEVIRQFMKRGIVVRTVINGLVFDGATQDPMQMAVRDALISFMAALSRRKPRRPKKRNAPVSSTPRPVMTLTAAGSRPSRATNWIRSATC
jgi:putative DNA-invertase from lambdoid prophage Rac